MQSKRPIIIGIAGGSGSGKTTIAHEIYDQLQQDDHILIMTQDSYYKNNDDLSMSERKKINYDHPDAFDMPLLVEQLRQLMDYKAVEMPVYDFTAHTRSEKTIHTEPADIIILEGILVLGEENLRNLMSIKVFVDTDDDIRFIRRLERDDRLFRGYRQCLFRLFCKHILYSSGRHDQHCAHPCKKLFDSFFHHNLSFILASFFYSFLFR